MNALSLATRGMVAGRCGQTTTEDRGSTYFETKTVYKDRIVEVEKECELPKVRILYFKDESEDIKIVVLNLDDNNLLL